MPPLVLVRPTALIFHSGLPLDKVVVEAVSLIGKRIDMLTIAEWVENQAILDSIQELGIDYAQGFHLHKPEIIKTPF